MSDLSEPAKQRTLFRRDVEGVKQSFDAAILMQLAVDPGEGLLFWTTNEANEDVGTVQRSRFWLFLSCKLPKLNSKVWPGRLWQPGHRHRGGPPLFRRPGPGHSRKAGAYISGPLSLWTVVASRFTGRERRRWSRPITRGPSVALSPRPTSTLWPWLAPLLSPQITSTGWRGGQGWAAFLLPD